MFCKTGSCLFESQSSRVKSCQVQLIKITLASSKSAKRRVHKTQKKQVRQGVLLPHLRHKSLVCIFFGPGLGAITFTRMTLSRMTQCNNYEQNHKMALSRTAPRTILLITATMFCKTGSCLFESLSSKAKVVKSR